MRCIHDSGRPGLVYGREMVSVYAHCRPGGLVGGRPQRVYSARDWFRKAGPRHMAWSQAAAAPQLAAAGPWPPRRVAPHRFLQVWGTSKP